VDWQPKLPSVRLRRTPRTGTDAKVRGTTLAKQSCSGTLPQRRRTAVAVCSGMATDPAATRIGQGAPFRQSHAIRAEDDPHEQLDS
jgi:hypothetical protein